MTASTTSDGLEYELGSGNIFEDLGFESPDEELEKAHLAYELGLSLKRRGWSQAQSAAALGTEQPRISRLLRGDTTGFSVERLMRFLRRLDRPVHIVVGPDPLDTRPAIRSRMVGITTGGGQDVARVSEAAERLARAVRSGQRSSRTGVAGKSSGRAAGQQKTTHAGRSRTAAAKQTAKHLVKKNDGSRGTTR